MPDTSVRAEVPRAQPCTQVRPTTHQGAGATAIMMGPMTAGMDVAAMLGLRP